jgi:hypothetical protein
VLRTDIRIIVPGRRRGDRMGERMVIRFSTFATLSALFGHGALLCPSP